MPTTGFNPQSALSYATMISLPRQVGTEGERIVAQKIIQKLQGFGFTVERQPFHCTTALGVFLAAEILTCQLLILFTLWMRISRPEVAFISILLIWITLGITGPLNRKVQTHSVETSSGSLPGFWSALCRRLGKKYSSENLIANLPASPPGAGAPHLYLVAHYDSKSQRIPLVVRLALFVIAIAGALVFTVDILLSYVYPAILPSGFVIAAIVIVAGIPLLFLDYGNSSAGAIDNASGVGLILHLAEVIAGSPQTLRELKVTALITGAEELGVKGALAYVIQNQPYLRSQQGDGGVHILNFDGPGVDGGLALVTGKSKTQVGLQSMVRQACQEFGYDLGRLALPGALYDHIPFSERGFDALSLIAIGKASVAVHTSADSPDKLHAKGFEMAGQITLRVIESLIQSNASHGEGVSS